jgi:hypothetical protein
MPPLPKAIILMFAPFAPLFSHRVWCQARVLRLGAIWAPKAHTVTAALCVMGLATERRLTNDHRDVNRTTGSTGQAGRMLLRCVDHVADAGGGHDRAGGGRYGGTPVWAENQVGRLTSGATVGELPTSQSHLLPTPAHERGGQPGHSLARSTVAWMSITTGSRSPTWPQTMALRSSPSALSGRGHGPSIS